MRVAMVIGSLVLSCALVGCTPDAPDATTDSPSPTSATAPSASPSPSSPSKKEDAATLKKALVTAADLGKPWTKPKSVSTVSGKKGEICPGHTSAVDKVPIRATVGANFTEGRGAGKNIGTFSLSTLADDSEADLAAAYAKDQKACARYRDATELYVVRSTEGPTTIAGSKPVTAWAERIYYDRQHTQLAYARHTVVVQQGRVLTYLSYSFLTTKDDPKAKDFSRATRLLEVQLDKNARLLA